MKCNVILAKEYNEIRLVHCNEMKWDEMQCNVTENNAVQCNKMRRNKMQCNHEWNVIRNEMKIETDMKITITNVSK